MNSTRKPTDSSKEKRFVGEDSFQKKVFPVIVPTAHRIDTKKRDSNGNSIMVVQDYEDVDNLEIAENPHFVRGFVSNKTYGKRAKEFRLREPVPDQAFEKKRPLHANGDGSGAQLTANLIPGHQATQHQDRITLSGLRKQDERHHRRGRESSHT